jgi:hypothetical protein
MSVALIGSSGGGAATLGHTNAQDLLRTIHLELHNKIQDSKGGIAIALFVSLHGGKGLDVADLEKDEATLYFVKGNECRVQAIETGTLKQVNQRCAELDQEIARKIQSGQISGLICISCDVDIHAATLKAAAERKIPVTGSGGTSLSAATSKFGIQLVGNAGGSVATTTYTRAVSYVHALAKAWGKDYRPFSALNHQVPQWTSILNACLPAFWAVALACRVIELLTPFLNDPSWLHEHVVVLLQSQALPTVCCVVMATSWAPHHGSTALMASAMASVLCTNSVLAGMVAGWLIASLVDRVLYQCIVWNIPATMTNLVVVGGTGAVVGVVVAPVVPFLQVATESIRFVVHFAMNGKLPGIGFLIGTLFCWGSKVGYYHAVFLPVILIEMERGAPSLLGAVDEATLVLVSAGICLANLLLPIHAPNSDEWDASKETVALCWRGLRINILFGDFIEVAYPFMEKSMVVNLAGYLASGVSVELLTWDSTRLMSSAYLPLPAAILLAKNWRMIVASYATAFLISFLGTAMNNLVVQYALNKGKRS